MNPHKRVEWHQHTGPASCSKCGQQTETYWVKWRVRKNGDLVSDADQALCLGCASSKRSWSL